MSRLAALARSLEARTVAVLLMAILAIHGGALLLYRQSAAAAADDAFARQVVSQLTLAREAVLRRPLPERDAEAKALSSAHFELGWSSISPPAPRRGGRPRPLVAAHPDDLPGTEPRERARPGDGGR